MFLETSIHQTPSKINSKKITHSPIIIKLINVSDKKYLKHQYIYKKDTMHTQEQFKRIILVFSSENTQLKEHWRNILDVLKEKEELSTKVLNIQLTFASESKIKTLIDRQKQRAYAPSASSSQELLKANTSFFCLACRSWKEHHSHPDK